MSYIERIGPSDVAARQAQARGAQISAVARLTPSTMVVNAVNSWLVAYVVMPTASPLVVVGWLCAVNAVVLLTFKGWFKNRLRRTRAHTASRATVNRATFYAVAIGILWGFVPAVWLRSASADSIIVIAAVTAGMMGAGGFALAALRRAAIFYVLLVTCGAFIGIATVGIVHWAVVSLLLVAYSAFLVQIIWINDKLFQDHFVAEETVLERGQVIETMHALSLVDPMTKLLNRTGFNDGLREQFAAAAGTDAHIALCLVDLDNFKSINDTFGHPTGDAVICCVADIFRDYASEVVNVGRLGGDEFAIAFGAVAAPGHVEQVIDQILKDLTTTLTIDGRTVDLRASIGVAFATPDETLESLVRKADIALYRAKEDGRGRADFYDEVMDRTAQEERELLDGLVSALKNEEFELHYQPIFDTAAMRVVACEALIRWNHPTRGPLQPGAFIHLIETSTVVGDVARWVLRRACRDAAAWPRDIRVSVNLSPANIGRAALLSDIVDALAEARLEPSRLELEITEALFIKHEEIAVAFTEQMRALGVRIALDDFGTGYSSLGYIARYPIDKIKIDRTFISGAAPLKSREAIVASVVKLAHDLDFETTAEGIETVEQLEWAKALGCQMAQGFFLGRPMLQGDLARFFPAHWSAKPELLTA